MTDHWQRDVPGSFCLATNKGGAHETVHARDVLYPCVMLHRRRREQRQTLVGADIAREVRPADNLSRSFTHAEPHPTLYDRAVSPAALAALLAIILAGGALMFLGIIYA